MEVSNLEKSSTSKFKQIIFFVSKAMCKISPVSKPETEIACEAYMWCP